MTPTRPASRLVAALFALLGAAAIAPAYAQEFEDEFPPEDVPRRPPGRRPPSGPPVADDWSGAVRVLRVPGAGTGDAEAKAAAEIFPDSTKVWMHVHGTDPRPVEAARRGARKWICSDGCDLTLPDDPGQPAGSTESTSVGEVATNPGDAMLRSIKVQTPTQPLPLTIWRPITTGRGRVTRDDTISGATTTGQLMFDPVVMGRRSYSHICSYGPVTQRAPDGEEVPVCRDGTPKIPDPDSAELLVGLHWPRTSELADFEFVAVTDTCGNAWVQPFQRTFAVPVFHVASGGCGTADGRVLRVFPSGGWVRVTAFNLDTPAAGNVVSATFRVTIPPLEDLVSANTPPLLFPDPRIDDITVDCGPEVLKARTDARGIPREAPDDEDDAPPKAPGQTPPPGMGPPGQTPPPGKTAPPGTAPGAAPVMQPRILPASTPTGQPLAHQGLVIAPEPLLRGNCRLEMHGQNKRRLVAPLALRVRITRTDRAPISEILDEPWIITPGDKTFRMPPLDPASFDGESRLRLEVYSDPLSPNGNMILLSDAGRVARIENISLTEDGQSMRRLIGSVTIHSAPLCGESNFETVEAAGSCLRGYFTVPAMLATLQVTRAPWVERPLITRNILSAVGVAFAVDSYDPVEREAFPIAFQVGGFVQDLGEDRLGLLSYVGVAPTIPILGEGGNTTSIGVLGGAGIEYISRSNGPDEGFKPAAFLSIVVQVGQANPAAPTGGEQFGTYVPPETTGGTY